MRLVGPLCLLVGCSFSHGTLNQATGDGGLADANDARPVDGRGLDACAASYSTLFDTCTVGVPGTPLVLSGMNTYNTDTNTLTMPGSTKNPPHVIVMTTVGPIDVLFVSSFTLETGATLRVTGVVNNRPFGIASSGAVQIDGLIDLSNDGAGARNDAACMTADGNTGQTDSGGGSGGGGGAYQGAGGNGGNGDKDGTAESVGALGGIAMTKPAGVLGGCDGGRGGDGNENGGEGGDGGGGVLIASATGIRVGANGVIHVGGGGGRAGIGNGGSGGGGGGGGSGGMILLESGSVMIGGRLAANGGGGGEGGDTATGDPGDPGGTSTTRAAGGSGNCPEGGDGAGGGAGTNLDGVTATQVKDSGGGGGGGGVGFIAVGPAAPTLLSGGIITPPHVAWP